MVRVEDFTHKEQKPLLPESASIDTLFPSKDDLETLLDIFSAAADHLADSLQAIVH